jgi:hypothetical protein
VEQPKESLPAAVRQVAAAARRADAGHPTPEDLLAYHAGELDLGRRQAVHNHLALCRDCTRTVLDLSDLPAAEAAAGATPVSRDELAARWQALVAALEAEALAPGSVLASPATASPTTGGRRPVGGAAVLRSRPVYRLALAASVVLSFALGAWSWTLRRQVEDLRAPQVNVVVSDLLPVEDARRRAGEDWSATVEVGPGRSPYVLILNLAEPSSFSTHRLEVERLDPPSPRVAWTEDGLEPGPLGSFHVAIPGDFLPAGSYRLQLFGLAGEELRLLAVYEARIARR